MPKWYSDGTVIIMDAMGEASMQQVEFTHNFIDTGSVLAYCGYRFFCNKKETVTPPLTSIAAQDLIQSCAVLQPVPRIEQHRPMNA